MTLYVKIWTDLMNDPWFVELSLTERSIYLQLNILAKERGDTGELIFKSWRSVAEALGGHHQTVIKIIQKLAGNGQKCVKSALKVPHFYPVKLEVKDNGNIHITLVNYMNDQRLRGPKDRAGEYTKVDKNDLREEKKKENPFGSEEKRGIRSMICGLISSVKLQRGTT